MNKEFCSYKQSLALKSIGFDEPCLKFYAEGKLILGINADNGDTNSKLNQYNELFISAPLKQQAFRFFRDRYNLEYQIVKSANGNYSVVIHKNTQEYLDRSEEHTSELQSH